MAHALDVADVFRADEVRPSLDRDAGPGQRPASRRRVLPGARRAGRGVGAVARCHGWPSGAREIPTNLRWQPAVTRRDLAGIDHGTDRPDRHRTACQARRGRGHLGRADRGVPRAHPTPRRPRSGPSCGSTATRPWARPRTIDRRRKAGKPVGRLGGLPVAVKDVLCTQGEPTTCASRMLENFRPPYDATVVARLQGGRRRADRQDQHGRVRHGRLDRELGLPARRTIPGTSTRIPGGSSGGAAACVAAGMAPLSVGTRHRRLDPPAGRRSAASPA